MDPLCGAVVARRVDRFGPSGQQLDPVGLHEQVDHERAAGLPLAVQTVTAVHEERLRRQPVADSPAGAPTVQTDTHRSKESKSVSYPVRWPLTSQVQHSTTFPSGSET